MRSPLIPLALVYAVLAACSPDSGPVAPTSEAPSLATAALSFQQVSGGSQHACAITEAGKAYCWGRNGSGELGNGESGGGFGSDLKETRPVAVVGGLKFRQISAGGLRTCGVTTDNIGYCWGQNTLGALGIGADDDLRDAPTPVAGGLRFLQIDTQALFHTCGVTTDRRIYCWGSNFDGQLGTGNLGGTRNAPVAVSSSLSFRQVAVGGEHTCAVTTTEKAYCWGDNVRGQLGVGTDQRRRVAPTPVAGGHAFRQISAGQFHTCAIKTTSRAFCWGDGLQGQIGDGKTFQRYEPRLVAGGHMFDRVAAGESHTCGETSANRVFCWGRGGEGQIGDGAATDRLVPVAVAGGHTFVQASAGFSASYGVTASGSIFSWGSNSNGQLGDGTTQTRTRPVPVVF